MFRKGGNAVDAAVAAAFASFIAEIGIVHLGGSGIAQLYDPASQTSTVYDFFSAMPGLGRNNLPTKIDFRPTTIDFGATTQDFWLGRASVAVSGNIVGLCRLAAEHGTLPLTTLLAPALDLAQNGIALPPFQAQVITLLGDIFTASPSTCAVFQTNGRLLQTADHLHIPHLHTTLSQIATQGADAIRTGDLAQAILADQQQNNGIITPQDLLTYDVTRTKPLRVPYRGYDVLLPGACSVGGILIRFTLSLLREFDVGSHPAGSTAALRLLYQAFAATTRARHAWEANKIHDLEAMAWVFGAADFQARYLAEMQAAVHLPLPEERHLGHTSHLSVVDDNGMAVTLTTTAGEGAGYIVPNTGFIPNNMLGEEDLNPHGWHQWQPGQRIPTMMTPLIVLKDGKVRLVTGSGGSARIRSALVQLIVNTLDHGMAVDTAVNFPRVHLENGVLQCELGYDETAVAQLEADGYPVNRWQNPTMYFGGAHTVARVDGKLVAAGDNRRDGHVMEVTNDE